MLFILVADGITTFLWILTDVDVSVADGSHLNNMMADVDANVVDEVANF